MEPDPRRGGGVREGTWRSRALAKLLVNGVIFALNQSVAELLALAERGGLDPARFYDALRTSAAGAPMLHYRREQYLDPDAPLTFTLDLAAKDVALLLAEAERHGTPATLTRVVLDRLRWATCGVTAARTWRRWHDSCVTRLVTSTRHERPYSPPPRLRTHGHLPSRLCRAVAGLVA